MKAVIAALAGLAAVALLPAAEARAQALLAEEFGLSGLFPAGQGHEAATVADGFTFPLGTYALGDTPLDLRLFTAAPAAADGFGDIAGWRHGDGRDGFLLRGGIEAQSTFSDPEVRLTPRLGFVYGRTDAGGGLAGFTSADPMRFPGDDGPASDRYGAELGLRADIPLAGDLSLYVDGAAGFTYDEAWGATSPGAGFPAGSFASGAGSRAEGGWHLGGTLGGGVAMDWGRLRGSVGAEFERWQEPTSQAAGDEPAARDVESRDSWVLKAQVKLRF